MPRARPLFLVVSCEHAGNIVPRRYAALFAPHADLLASHRGWDPGALPIARAIAVELDAPLFAATITRLLVEPNRSRRHPSLFSAITRGLDDEQKDRIIARYYTPHLAAVRHAIDDALSTRSHVLHVGVHTFTPVLDADVRRADIGLLYDPRRASERLFCDRWAHALHDADPTLRVRRNYPYRGASDGLTTSLRRELPARAYLGVELEVNQALAASADSRVRRSVRVAVVSSLRAALRRGT